MPRLLAVIISTVAALASSTSTAQEPFLPKITEAMTQELAETAVPIYEKWLVANELRDWKSGKHGIEARAVSVSGDKVRLRRSDNKNVNVSIDRLSDDDKTFLNKYRLVLQEWSEFE